MARDHRGLIPRLSHAHALASLYLFVCFYFSLKMPRQMFGLDTTHLDIPEAVRRRKTQHIFAVHLLATKKHTYVRICYQNCLECVVLCSDRSLKIEVTARKKLKRTLPSEPYSLRLACLQSPGSGGGRGPAEWCQSRGSGSKTEQTQASREHLINGQNHRKQT